MNRRGVTLIEALIAGALLTIAAVGMTFLFSASRKSLRRVTETSAFTRALAAIEKDVMRDMVFIPPQDGDETLTEHAAFETPVPVGSPAGTLPAPRAYVSERCYDPNGVPVGNCTNFLTDGNKAYWAQFFKERVRDQSLDPASPLNRIPMSRVRFRVYSKSGGALEPAFFFSRLETGVIRY